MDEMWIARDSDGTLTLFFDIKPVKYKGLWYNLGSGGILVLERSLFPEVQWTDEEPTKVKLIIER